MSSDPQQLNVEILSWREARDLVIPVNPGLAAQIDQLDPSDDLKLIKATYNFGDTIRDGSQFYLPTANGTVEIHDASVARELQEMLITDTTMPFGITLDRMVELDVVVENRFVPFIAMPIGRTLGVWGMIRKENTPLHSGRDWRLTAGARAIAMLPKTSDIVSFRKLKEKYAFNGHKPKDYTEQWQLFKELALHAPSAQCWTVTLLYFSNDWHRKLSDPSWITFRSYLYELGWDTVAFLRDQLVFEIDFPNILIRRNLKPSPYHMDTLKHLYGIATGYYLGFEFAATDNLAPVNFLQEIFAEVYGLKYLPSIIQPGYMSFTDTMRPVYYSLEWPTVTKLSPKSDRTSTKLTDLRDIHHMLGITLEEILKNRSEVADSKIYQLAEKLRFDCYHFDPDKYGDILPTTKIPQLDKTLLAEKEKYHLDFCASSALIRGCIRIGIK